MVSMEISDLRISEKPALPQPGLLERLSLPDKLPMALGFGCLLGLSAPGLDIWWLAWVGLAPLLVLVAGCQGKTQAALIGLAFGLGYNLVALCWCLGLYPLDWLGLSDWLGFECAVCLWLAESFHQALLVTGFAVFVKALPMRSGFLPSPSRPFFPFLLSVPVLWIFFRWVVGTSEAFLGVPVNQLAYSQCGQLELIQLARLGGAQAIEFLMLLSNAAIATLVIDRLALVPPLFMRADLISPRFASFVDIGLVAVLVGGVCAWGGGQASAIAAACAITDGVSAEHVPVPVAVVQGNLSVEDRRSAALVPSEKSAGRYLSLVDHLGVPLVVLPEGVTGSWRVGDLPLADRLKAVAIEQKKEILVGSLDHVAGGVVDTLRLLPPRADGDDLYVKRRLVPFAEYTPFPATAILPPRWRSLLSGACPELTGAPELLLPRSVWGRVGGSLSLEVVYPQLIAAEVRRGASLLVNLADLSWFHNSILSRQLLAAAIMRAVENERYLVLATNTGISAVIDPSGCVTSSSLSARQGVLIDTVQFLYRKTPFTKMWWL